MFLLLCIHLSLFERVMSLESGQRRASNNNNNIVQQSFLGTTIRNQRCQQRHAMARESIDSNKDRTPLIRLGVISGLSGTAAGTGYPSPTAHRIIFKYASLFIIVVQTSVMVLLLRYSKTQKINGTDKGPRYLSSTAIVVSEVLKLLVCFGVLAFRSSDDSDHHGGARYGGLDGLVRTLRVEVYGKPLETCKLLVPAGLYTIQNNLLFLALGRLDAATYQVTYQLKILTTALFSVLLLKRRLSLQQWLSLILLMAGVALVQMPAAATSVGSPAVGGIAARSGGLGESGVGVGDSVSGGAHRHQHQHHPVAAAVAAEAGGIAQAESSLLPESPPSSASAVTSGVSLSRLIGLAAVLLASLSSGFAGVFYERLLKQSTQELWVRNTQLALFGILLGAGAVIVVDLQRVLDGGFFQGYNGITWGVVFLQTFGGLVVSYATKYADAILKGFATSISIVVSTAASWCILNDFEPSVNFFVGTAIVIAATVSFGMPRKS